MEDENFTKLLSKLKELYPTEYKNRQVVLVKEEGKCLICGKDGIKVSNLDPIYICIEHVPVYFDTILSIARDYDQVNLIAKLELTAKEIGLNSKREYLVRFRKSRGLIDIVILNENGNFGIEVINNKSVPKSKTSKQYRRTVNHSRLKIKALGRGAIIFTNFSNKLNKESLKKILKSKQIKVYQ